MLKMDISKYRMSKKKTTFTLKFSYYVHVCRYLVDLIIFLINSDSCTKPDFQSTSPPYDIPSQNLTRGN